MGAGNNLESFSPKVSRPLESKQEGPLESCSPVVSSVQKKELEGHWGRWPAPGHPGVCQTLNQNPHLLTPRPVPVGKGDGLVPRWDRWQRKANDCPALPPPCSVTLGKSLPFSEPPGLLLENKIMIPNSAFLPRSIQWAMNLESSLQSVGPCRRSHQQEAGWRQVGRCQAGPAASWVSAQALPSVW